MASPRSTAGLVGRTVDAGRLNLLKLLGSGASGEVYQAVERTTSSDSGPPACFAVKYIPKSDCKSEDDSAILEFALHMSVSHHPNVVTLHRVFDGSDAYFAVMDLAPGGDLFAAIKDGSLYSGNSDLLKETYLQILDAVEFCHDNGVFHRDLKPDNILCDQDGMNIKLADFGLATSLRSSTDFGVGSQSYMSPECLGDSDEKSPKKYLHRNSDVWSLGIILVNMICAVNPWEVALRSDACFHWYSRHPNWLVHTMPISQESYKILKRILNIDPSTRITLKNLRKKVIKVQTFFNDSLGDEPVSDLPEESTGSEITSTVLAISKAPPSKLAESGSVTAQLGLLQVPTINALPSLSAPSSWSSMASMPVLTPPDIEVTKASDKQYFSAEYR